MALVEVAIEPKATADRDRLVAALDKMVTEDPSMTVHTDRESGQIIIGGISENQVDAKIDILRRTYKIGANVGAPQVAYRETIGKRTEIDYTHKKETGCTCEFARVKLVFEPGAPGSGFIFESKVVDGAVPNEFIPGVMRGLDSAKENGLLAGFPLIDFSATLIDGAYHDADSSILAFDIAARAAFRELRAHGRPMLLEPIVGVEVVTPDEYMGDVIGELNSRRGHILASETRGGEQALLALVPLARMFGFELALHGFSQGQAQFTMTYDHYAPVPAVYDGGPDLFPPAAAMRA